MMLSHPVLLGFLWSLLLHSTSGEPEVSGQETNKVYAYSYHFTHNGTTNSQDILRNFLGTDPDFGNDPPPGQSIIKTFSSPSIRGFFTKGVLPAGPGHNSFGSSYNTNSAIDNIKKVVEANLQPPPEIGSRLLPPISPDITNGYQNGFNNGNDIGLNFQRQDDFPKIPPPPPLVPFQNSQPLQNIPPPPVPSIAINDFPKIPDPVINNNGVSRIENFSRNTRDGGKVEGQIETFSYNPPPVSNSHSNYEHLSEGFRRNEKFSNNNQDVTGHRTQSYFRQQFRTVMPNSEPSTLQNHKNRIANNNAVNANHNNQWWNVLNVLGGNNNNEKLGSNIERNQNPINNFNNLHANINNNVNHNINSNLHPNINNNVNRNINNNLHPNINNNANRNINNNVNNLNKVLPRQFGSRLSNPNKIQNTGYNNQNNNLNNQNINFNNQNGNLNNHNGNLNNRNINFNNHNGNLNNRHINFNNQNGNLNNQITNNAGFRTDSHPNVPFNRIDSNEVFKPILNNMFQKPQNQNNNLNNQQQHRNNQLNNINNPLTNSKQQNNAFNNDKTELSNRFNNDDTTKNVLNIINEVNEKLNNLNNNGGGRNNNNNNFRLTWDDEVPQLFNNRDWSHRQSSGNGRPFSNAHAGPLNNQGGPNTVDILKSAMEALVDGRPMSVPEIPGGGLEGGNYRNSGGGGLEKFFASDKVVEGPNSFSRNQQRGFERNFHVNSNAGYQRNNNWSTNAVRRLDALSTKADFSKDFIDVFRDDY